MSEITHRTVETNGIRMHVAEQGAGPLVSSVPRLPRVLVLLAPPARRAGRRPASTPSRPTCAATARPTRPADIESYTLLHLVGDMVGLLDALGEKTGGDRRPRLGRAGGLARRACCGPIASAASSV